MLTFLKQFQKQNIYTQHNNSVPTSRLTQSIGISENFFYLFPSSDFSLFIFTQKTLNDVTLKLLFSYTTYVYLILLSKKYVWGQSSSFWDMLSLFAFSIFQNCLHWMQNNYHKKINKIKPTGSTQNYNDEQINS